MFKLLRSCCLVLPLLVIGYSALAQRRIVSGLELLPGVQAEYALSGDDYLFLSVGAPLRTGGYQGLHLDRLGLTAGYEQFWNSRWSGGGTVGLSAYGTTRNGGDVSYLYVDVVPELFVRHWNTLGAFNFRQRLGVEYLIPGNPDSRNQALARLRLDLDRVFLLGEKLALRPRFAYEASAYLRFQRDEDQLKERTLDFGSLRGEVGFRLSPHFDVTPWVAYQTAYRRFLPFFDINGNEVSGGRSNFIVPVIGLDLRLTVGAGATAAERRQLPSQH